MSEIKPAMEGHQWAPLRIMTSELSVSARDGKLQLSAGAHGWDRVVIPDEMRPAIAALALHGQPFGFTWEDVDELRRIADEADESERVGEKGGPFLDGPTLRSLAGRIEALLPPRTP